MLCFQQYNVHKAVMNSSASTAERNIDSNSIRSHRHLGRYREQCLAKYALQYGYTPKYEDAVKLRGNDLRCLGIPQLASAECG